MATVRKKTNAITMKAMTAKSPKAKAPNSRGKMKVPSKSAPGYAKKNGW